MMDLIEPDDLFDDDEEYEENMRRERAHRFLEREFALGYHAKQKPSGLIIVKEDIADNEVYGQYL
jgi:hypothetical protein